METRELSDDEWERITNRVARRAPDAFDGLPCPVKITHRMPNGEEYIIYEKGSTEYDPESDR